MKMPPIGDVIVPRFLSLNTVMNSHRLQESVVG